MPANKMVENTGDQVRLSMPAKQTVVNHRRLGALTGRAC
jgi:hypothetical protein